ncbi:MAG: hypothetical protein EAX86_10350 [Candidatus Heimdallarchaeota archaeon]|nr:hypothetical protein [Candidatus Heimdallarchaeota archaeon]
MEFQISDQPDKRPKPEELFDQPFIQLFKQILDRASQLIHSHIEKSSSFVEFGYEARLLESLLLASYFTLYTPEKATISEETLIQIARQTNNPSILSFLDQHLQNSLFNLYYICSENFTSDSLSRKVDAWISEYNSILADLFKTDAEEGDLKRYFRKILSFNLLALYTSPDDQVKERIYSFLTSISAKLNVSGVNLEEIDVWRRVYYYLFLLIVGKQNNDSSLIQSNYLRDLFELQSNDGTWQKNQFLTLLVLHTVKYFALSTKYPDLIQHGIHKSEVYLSRKEGGLSVLNSMKLYNSSLFFFFKWLFEGNQPPFSTIISLLTSQNEDGGWPLQPQMLLSDVDTTIFVMLTLLPYYHTKEEIMKAINRGLKFIRRTSRDDGGSSMYLHSTETLAEMTARLVMLYALLPPTLINEEMRIKMINSAFLNLLESQEEDGSFKYCAYSFSDIYPLSQIAIAIYLVQVSPFTKGTSFEAQTTILKTRILDCLMTSVNTDGGYSPKLHISSKSEQQSTCYAAIIWALLDPSNPLFEKSLLWLQYLTKGQMKSFPEGTGPRPIRYNDLAHGPIFIYLSMACFLFSHEPKGIELLENLKLQN